VAEVPLKISWIKLGHPESICQQIGSGFFFPNQTRAQMCPNKGMDWDENKEEKSFWEQAPASLYGVLDPVFCATCNSL
jgi:hypothetical protein